MDIFSQRLTWARENKGLTKKEMAEEIGMSPQGYGKIENGQREPNLEALAKLPGILHESTDFLLGVTMFDKKAKAMRTEFKSILRMVITTRKELDEFADLATDYDDLKEGVNRLDSLSRIVGYYSIELENLRNTLITYLNGLPGNHDNAEEVIANIEIKEQLEMNLRLTK